MTPERSTKEKILAIFTVVFLFFIVGGLLFLISYKNKEASKILKDKVLRQQIIKANAQKLEKIEFDNSALSEVTSRSFITLAVTEQGTEKILIQKNPDLPLPIASITKLMVGTITLENIDLETEIMATTDYIGKEESAFVLEANKKYKVRELLANALISSDNDSARLLSSAFGENNFLDKMNQKAKELGMTQTNHVNVTGLDPQTPATELNVSTVTDLARLVIYIQKNHPEILKITTNSQYNLCDVNNYCKIIANTNKLLENSDFKYEIIGGKTGNTDLAGKNLALVTEITDGVSLISIVLGSENNFADITTLIKHIQVKN